MADVRNILFPTDLSDDSFAAWPHALDFAKKFGATIHAVTVVEELYALAPYENYGVMVQAMRDMLPQIERRLQERVKDPPTGVPVRTAVIEAVTPSAALLDYVKKNSIDLIIMATHGRGAIAHALLGSVAERLTRTAPVPVMTVRPKGR
jgi:nucleotide-binding universal stress UspA family protein